MKVSGRLLQISLLLIFPLAALSAPAKADSLTISYNVSQNQTALVGAGFTVVTFTGSITNNSNAPIAFQTLGFAVPSEHYVASVAGGIAFPGITLNPGESTGIIDLSIVTLNPFDPSLPYPGLEQIVFRAIDHTGGTIAENDAMITVVRSIPEPPAVLLLASSLLGLVVLLRKSRIAMPGNSA
jgi:hypothetical protein